MLLIKIMEKNSSYVHYYLVNQLVFWQVYQLSYLIINFWYKIVFVLKKSFWSQVVQINEVTQTHAVLIEIQVLFIKV